MLNMQPVGVQSTYLISRGFLHDAALALGNPERVAATSITTIIGKVDLKESEDHFRRS